MRKHKFIYFDGEYWKFKNETINKNIYENKDGETRIFCSWQIAEGSREYAENWNKSKAVGNEGESTCS